MPNDTPAVDQPNRSPHQPNADRLARGDDRYADVAGPDQYDQARAYGEHLKTQAKGRMDLLKKLTGSKAAYESLQGKTMPLARSSQPHVLEPAGDNAPGDGGPIGGAV